MRTISYAVYREGLDELDEARRTKEAAKFWADIYAPDWPEEENPSEIHTALVNVKAAARELERALRAMLAVYERQEMAEYPEAWEFASPRRSA